ncbi:MAG: anhydro-N-acetylmuramic acid kinase [Candidatus Hydrogenedentes bacterium]|nr:anhydro-N-acetylmuramic acid kinase [Candidatus Hydrogenedentota bacterium]
MNLNAIRKKEMRYGIGLEAGSTCRGINACLLRIKGAGPGLHIKLVRHQHFALTAGLRTRLMAARFDAREMGLLNCEVGEQLAEAACEMINLAKEESIEVDFVASDGHTLALSPPRGGSISVGVLQLGEPAMIAERVQLPVVSDFRARDLAAGGQGSPISAYADWLLFAKENRTVVCLHLGGTPRIVVVPPKIETVIAFDTGPGMLAIDGAVRLLTAGTHETDQDGASAGRGVVIDEFLEYLLDHPYLGRVPPKGAAREDFGADGYLRDALAARKGRSFEDLIATVTTAVAYSIIRAYNRFVKPQYEVARFVVSGGGVLNKTLMACLRNGLPDTVVRTSDEYGLPGPAHDVVGCTILANETICGTPTLIPGATGARRPALLGKITPN